MQKKEAASGSRAIVSLLPSNPAYSNASNINDN